MGNILHETTPPLTRAKEILWIGDGPYSAKAARWRLVGYPLCWANPYSGYCKSYSCIKASRYTLATMLAAATALHEASALTTACCLMNSPGIVWFPSTMQKSKLI